jgi:hypothetical protein
LYGSLAYHEKGSHLEGIGAPIAPAVALAKSFIAKGYEVRICTARVWCPQDERWMPEKAREVARQKLMIMDWTEKHIGKRLQVTCEKDPGMLVLFDDRAIQVIRNTGMAVFDEEEWDR